MKFTIDRSKWRFGGDNYPLTKLFGDTVLCNSANDLMCCLGHVSLQLGVPKDDIRGVDGPGTVLAMWLDNGLTPSDRARISTSSYNSTDVLTPERIVELKRGFPSPDYEMLACVKNIRCSYSNRLVVRQIVLCEEAIRVNDDSDLGHATRERMLIELFDTHGHELEFTGEYLTEMLNANPEL